MFLLQLFSFLSFAFSCYNYRIYFYRTIISGRYAPLILAPAESSNLEPCTLLHLIIFYIIQSFNYFGGGFGPYSSPFGVRSFLGREMFLGREKKFGSGKFFWLEKNFEWENFLGRKIFLGREIFMGRELFFACNLTIGSSSFSILVTKPSDASFYENQY